MSDSRCSQMHINLFILGLGHHEASWRLPASRPDAVLDFEYYRHAAVIGERGKLDSIFFADGLFVGPNVRQRLISALEPISLLAALASVTSRIGLIATASTGYNEPFNLARRFATLDHISGGRGGWNIVTSGALGEAKNFGLDAVPEHSERYRRASEFVDVANKLWDSWDEAALVGDKQSGTYVETDLLHPVAHDGEFFSVAGPLGVPRSPQGRPVLIQAGSSDEGKDFAAAYAEAVFTAQPTFEEAQGFYRDLKARTERAGRGVDQIKILPGLSPIVGATEEEARRFEEELANLIVTDHALAQLSFFLDQEITADQLDEKLPSLPGEEAIEGHKSRFSLIVNMARSEDLTVRQLIGRLAGGRGHRTTVGTPEQIADEMELWFRGGAADGFNLMPPSIPDQLEVFVDNVIPILQERGLFRREYEGETLRDHYGLARPESAYAQITKEPIVA